MRIRALVFSTLTLLFALALVACGGADADEQAVAPASAPAASTDDGMTAGEAATAASRVAKAMAMPEPQPIDLDPCILLTAEDAAPYLKEPGETIAEGGTELRPFHECRRTDGSWKLHSVTLGVAGGMDAEAFERWVRGNAELAKDASLKPVDGLGDRAFSRNGFLFVHQGDATLNIRVSTASVADDEAKVAAATTIARAAVARL